ncbi:MAG: hypothetical protein WAW80_01275 [Candidatus Saccharimonadales bacterium]
MFEMSLESIKSEPEPDPEPRPDLLRIMKTVNETLPSHGRGIISPEQMRQKKAASCFGRHAIIGSQLINEGFNPDQLAWLISLNHGMRQTQKYTKAKYNLGHAFLAVNGDAPTLVDTIHGAFLQDSSRTSWLPENGHNQTLPIIDRVVANEVVEPNKKYKFGNVTNRASQPNAARTWALRAFFSYHTFDQGLEFYQSEHPDFRKKKHITVGDYADFYHELDKSRICEPIPISNFVLRAILLGNIENQGTHQSRGIA